MDLPLTESDLLDVGLIEPSAVIKPLRGMPTAAVVCYFNELVTAMADRAGTRRIATLEAAHGRHAVYEIERRGERVAVFHPGVGAPLAAGFLEEMIALGCRCFVAVGGAGALVPDLVLGQAVVVDSAVRDEGTSFHYLEPSRVVDADVDALAVLQRTLDDAGEAYVTGRTWTTDAIYRETRARMRRRVDEGCLTVDMEASAFFAVARYRRVRMAQLLYAGDSLAGDVWDDRKWTSATAVRERLFWIAADASLRLGGSRAGDGT